MSLIVDPDAMSLILAWSHTFVEFDDEIFSINHLLPITQEGWCQLQAKVYVHEVLANPLVKLDQDKCD